jgi:Zn-dependent membrane protease YugP
MIIILIVFMLIGWLVSNKLKNKFKKYSLEPLSNGMSGKDIAEKMLDDHGIRGVKVVSVPGKLSDHYNPSDKTINLSPDVYSRSTVAAAAVAAHECGHAVQHATAYSWLQLRSALVPAVAFSSKMLNYMFIAMFLGIGFLNTAESFGFGYQQALLLIIVFQGAITIFSLVTLPVEFDASNRALVWLKRSNITNQRNHAMAQDALKWAAGTYLVAAIASITQLAYYVMLYLGNRD